MGRRDKVDPIEALRWQQYNALPTATTGGRMPNSSHDYSQFGISYCSEHSVVQP